MISFYEQPNLQSVYPIEGSTKQTVELSIYSTNEKPFATRNILLTQHLLL
jgi:hypothetical protein